MLWFDFFFFLKYLLSFSLFYSIFFSSVLYLKRILSYFQLLCSTQNSLYLSYSAPYCLYSIQFDSIQSFSIIFHSCISFNSCPQGHDTLNLISTSNQFFSPPVSSVARDLQYLCNAPRPSLVNVLDFYEYFHFPPETQRSSGSLS